MLKILLMIKIYSLMDIILLLEKKVKLFQEDKNKELQLQEL